MPLFALRRRLSFQIPLIIGAILVVPILVMLYDLAFASKTDEITLVNKEERLATIVRILATDLGERIEGQVRDLPASSQAAVLSENFTAVASPLAREHPGVRLGLYVPASDQIFAEGFLHEYRRLTPTEEREREQRIYREASSGITAVLGSGEPLARLAGNPDDQFFEHLVPLYDGGKLVAVVWAEERLNPIFTQSRNFRMVTRYFSLFSFFLGAVGTLFVVNNFVRRVGQIRSGLEHMERNIHVRLPAMPGEMGQISLAINKMASALEEKERLEERLRRAENLAALGRLVTGLAHELRNPIGIIKATVQVMEKDPGVAGVEEYAAVVKEQVNRQNRVLTELLEFGRPSRGVILRLNPADLLRSVLTFTESLFRQNRVALELHAPADLPAIQGDGEKLKQVFVNLVLNAVQAMPDGGTLRVVACGDREWVSISFQDTGRGIHAVDIGHIFDPYYTTRDGGHGLGLAISHQIIEMHGGRIEVESEPGKGATFTVVLPVAGEESPERGEAGGGSPHPDY
ncbi:MAG: ATP-binding protein [Thermoanaerobacterales bacterium]|nr:ATP-binding protein [Bacillota bacterium]MDI6905946.1 ATP-binding protein [Thermoanaerobacterales bacterium]